MLSPLPGLAMAAVGPCAVNFRTVARFWIPWESTMVSAAKMTETSPLSKSPSR